MVSRWCSLFSLRSPQKSLYTLFVATTLVLISSCCVYIFYITGMFYSQYIFTFNKTFPKHFLSAHHGGLEMYLHRFLKLEDLDYGKKGTDNITQDSLDCPCLWVQLDQYNSKRRKISLTQALPGNAAPKILSPAKSGS